MPSRDYQLAGFAYEPRVLSIPGWYVNLQHEEPLVSEHEDLADALREEKEQIEAVLHSRQAALHQLVWWRRVERVTCTCGLVLRSVERLLEPLGHLDPQTWRPATDVVVHLPYDEAPYLAACQRCGEQQRCEALPPARAWTAAHVCPSTGGPTEGGPTEGDELHEVRLGSGETFDDAIHRLQRDRLRRLGGESRE